MKIDKNTANAYACYEKYSKYCNTVYIVQELHTFLKHSIGSHLKELHSKFHYEAFYFHQCLQYILQLIYQLICFYTYNYYNQNVLQHHMIYYIHIHNY